MQAEQWELVSEESDGTRHYRHRRTRASIWTKPNCEVESPGYGPTTTAELITLTGEKLPEPPEDDDGR